MIAFLPTWLIYGFLFTIGAVIGSFLNVCIFRIAATNLKARYPDPVGPQVIYELRRFRIITAFGLLWKGFWIQVFAAFKQAWVEFQSLSSRPSHCPRCGTDICWYDNIPIFGWLKLRGQCRACKMRISARYPSIELLNGLLWVLVFWFEVPHDWRMDLEQSCLFTELGPQAFPGLGWLSAEGFVIARYLFHMLLIEALLVATFIDIDHRIIPDGTTVPFMCIGVIASTVVGRLHLVPVWFQSPRLLATFGIITPEWLHPFLDGAAVPPWITNYPHLHGFAVSFLGLVIGGGLVWLVRALSYWALRQEAMGFGDVMLMGMVGAFIGWQASIIAFFVGAMIAVVCVLPTIFVRTDNEIPYGPYLSAGSLVTILFWSEIFDRFSQVFNLGVLIFLYGGLLVIGLAMSLWIVRIFRKLSGRDYREPEGQWTAGDQNWFFAGEKVDRHTNLWKTEDWEGCAAAHGTVHEERWRNGGSGTNNALSHRTNRLH